MTEGAGTMIACPECGHSLPEDANFCSNCGASLKQSSADTTKVIPAFSNDEPAVSLTTDQLRMLGDVPEGAGVLIVVRGPNEGTRFVIDSDVVTAGRSVQSDIFLDDVTVSRNHAKLTRRGGHVWLSDLNSLNGTYVNRALIDGEVALRSDDEVQIGKFRLVYRVDGAGAS